MFATGYSDPALISKIRGVVADSNLTTASIDSHAEGLRRTLLKLRDFPASAMAIAHKHQVRMLPLQDTARDAAKNDGIDQMAAEFEERTLTEEQYLAWEKEMKPAPPGTGHNYLRFNTGEHGPQP